MQSVLMLGFTVACCDTDQPPLSASYMVVHHHKEKRLCH